MAVLAALAFPSASPAAVTIGSDLDHAANDAPNCGAPCTYTQATLIPANTAPGGLTAPTAGVAVRFRVRFAGVAPTIPITFRVIRPAGGGVYTGAGTSAPLFPPTTGAPGAVYGVDARLPVAAGDSIGIDCCPDGQQSIAYRPAGPHVSEGTVLSWVAPALSDGSAPRASNNGDPDYELLANADIEPDADMDGFGDETQDGCPQQASTQGACIVKKTKKRCKKKKRKKGGAATKKKCKKKGKKK
jgi:hypothetical protein